jgi:hypothetical protein
MATNSSRNITSVDVALAAAGYNMVSSTAFLLAPMLAYLCLCAARQGARPSGGFGKFMIVLELVDSVPEAAIIADATASGTLSWTFVVSIFFLNLSNTFATAIDYTATRSSTTLHRMLFSSIFFSVGMLMYSIPTTVYGSFKNSFMADEIGWLHAVSLVAGTFVGAALIVLLMHVEHRKEQNAPVSQSDPQVAVARTQTVLQNAINEHRAILAEFRRHDEPNKNAEYAALVRRELESRVQKLSEIQALLTGAGRLSEGVSSPITDDAHRLVSEQLTDELADSALAPLLSQRGGGSVESLGRRVLKLLLIMLAISTWSVLLTFALSFLFYFLAGNEAASYADLVCEGLSGGAFLATVAGTSLPRLQQDAYRANLSTLAYRTVGILAFELGLLMALFLDLLLGQPKHVPTM